MDTPDPTISAPPPPPPPPPIRTRRLLRRPADGHLGGVCAGIADYLGVDVTIVRLLAVVLTFAGPGAPAYLVAWVLVPPAQDDDPRWTDQPMRDFRLGDSAPQAIGIGLLFVAALVVWDDWGWPGDRFLLPLALIAGGVVLLLRSSDEDDRPPAWSPTAPAPAPTSTLPVPVAPTYPAYPAATSPYDEPAAAPHEEPRRRRRTLVTPVTFGVGLLWAGATLLLGLSVETSLAVGLGILAAGLLVGAVVGGGRGLIFPGVVVGLSLAGVAAVDVPITGGAGERDWYVDEAADVDGPFRLAMGEAVLDLRGLDPGIEETVAIEASVAFGRLEVQLPDDVPVELHASTQAGGVILPGQDEDSGLDVEEELVDPDRRGVGTIVLDLEVGAGQIEVVR